MKSSIQVPRNSRGIRNEEFVNPAVFVSRRGRDILGGCGYMFTSVVDKGVAELLTAVSSETLFLQIFALDPKQQG